VSMAVLHSIVLFIVSALFGAVSSYASVTADSTGFLSDSTRSNVNLFIQAFYVIVWLFVVLILLVFALWVLRKVLRFKGVTGIAGGAVQILEIQHIDPKKSIALVRILDRVLIVGCTENAISGLGELSADEIGRLKIEEPQDTKVFGTILSRLTGKNSPTQTGADKQNV